MGVVEAGGVRVGDVAGRVSELAGALRTAGVGPGDRVGVAAGHSPAQVVGVLAAMAAGGVAVPLDASSPVARLGFLAGHADVRAVVGPEGAGEGWAAAGRVTVDAGGRPSAVVGDVRDRLPGPGPGLLLYTSGSTGSPKGVLLDEGAVLASTARAARALGWSAATRLLGVLPLHHGHGLLMTALAPLLAGGTVLLAGPADVWLLARFWSVVAEAGATNVSLVPAAVRLLVGGAAERADSTLRFVTCASSPLQAGLRTAFEARFGVPLLEAYGLTEMASWCAWPNPASPAPGAGRPDPGTVTVDQGGEVHVRGPQRFREYWRNPAATAAALGPDGSFRTGDLGRLADGVLHLSGRTVDVIDCGGAKIHPEEVEEVLLAHPEVADAAVVGVPAGGVEVPVAFVVLRRDLDPGAIDSWCGARLPGWMCPRRYLVETALARGAVGKVSRADLRERARARLGG